MPLPGSWLHTPNESISFSFVEMIPYVILGEIHMSLPHRVRWLKVPATKPDGLNIFPGSHGLSRVVPRSPCGSRTPNSQINKNFKSAPSTVILFNH